jgi:hypothetical protein
MMAGAGESERGRVLEKKMLRPAKVAAYVGDTGF